MYDPPLSLIKSSTISGRLANSAERTSSNTDGCQKHHSAWAFWSYTIINLWFVNSYDTITHPSHAVATKNPLLFLRSAAESSYTLSHSTHGLYNHTDTNQSNSISSLCIKIRAVWEAETLTLLRNEVGQDSCQGSAVGEIIQGSRTVGNQQRLIAGTWNITHILINRNALMYSD